jgi:hypothetical protein
MIPSQLPALYTEITTDPLKLGYAGLSPSAQAAILNSPTGAGSGAVNRLMVRIDDPAVAAMLAYALKQLHGMVSTNPSLVAYYQTVIATINSVGFMQPQDVNTQAVISAAISDGVLDAAIVAPVSTRTGSRAEVLFGDGTVVMWQDILASGA